MTNFEFKETDQAGMSTLEVMAEADKLNEWMYDTIKSDCSGEILEIGSGIGNISDYFLKNGNNLTVSDIRKNYCDALKKRFSQTKNCKGIIQMDISDPSIASHGYPLAGKFNSIFTLNVVEHIKDDNDAVRNCHNLLVPGGSLVILVPSGKWLYNSFDRELEHYRRYSRKELIALVEANGFKVYKIQNFNFVGIFGWFIFGSILRNKLISKGQTKFYNFFVPIIKLFDILVFRRIGLSVIVFATKK